jgi:hypothetical protein
MEAFLAAVKKSLLLVLGAALVVFFLALPRPANRPLIGALREVSAFRSTFAQADAEQVLRSQAEARGAMPLSTVEAAARGKRGPKLTAAPDARPVRPFSAVSLATLAQVDAHAKPATVGSGVPEAEALAASIVWRLARTEQPGPFTLRSVELVPAEVGDADIALEREVAKLRIESLEARAAVEATEARLPTLEQRVEFQSNNRSKYLGKSIMALKEARDLLAVQKQTHADIQTRYDQSARKADTPRKQGPGAAVPTRAVARVMVASGGGSHTFDIPVPLAVREVPVGALPGVTFEATRKAGLWDEVKGEDAASATETIRAHFNWHMARVEVVGFELLGAHLLQVVPLILPVLLVLLLRHIRRARTSYNPFTTEVPEKEPSIGLKSRLVEFFALIALPLAAVGNAIAALLLVGQLPLLPALAGLFVLWLGSSAFKEVQELREQTLSIVRSHSNLPPAPSVAKL